MRGSDFGERGVREYIEQHALAFFPHAVHAAGRLQSARAAAVGAYVESDRTFDRLDNIAEGDGVGLARELVTAARTATRMHQTAAHQVADNFFEIVLRDVLVSGD